MHTPIFTRPLHAKIERSPYYQGIRMCTTDQLIEEALHLGSVGSLVYGTPHQFICILQCLNEYGRECDIVRRYGGMLPHSGVPVVLLMFYARMVLRSRRQFRHVVEMAGDSRQMVAVVEYDSTEYMETIGELACLLENETYVFGIYLGRFDADDG